MRNIRDGVAGRLPFVVHTRRGQWDAERNAFNLGRDYQRGVDSGVIK